MAWYSIFTHAYNSISGSLKNNILSVIWHVFQSILSDFIDIIENLISSLLNSGTSLILSIINRSQSLGLLGLPIMIIGLTAVFLLALIVIKGIGEIA